MTVSATTPEESESDRPRRAAAAGWPNSLAAGFLAGALAGLTVLGWSLARQGADFLAYWPTPALAAWLTLRSFGLYPLIFGAAGLGLAALLHPAVGRAGRSTFGPVLGAMAATVVFIHLTAWWQIAVLIGLPMDDPARWRAAGLHGAAALAVGAAVTGLLRLGSRCASPDSLRRWGLAALAVAMASFATGEIGLGRSSSHGPGRGAGRPGQVVVVGLDGMTLRVLSPLMRAGELPAFQRLMNEGAWGTLLTYGTAASPQIWTSMATGKRVREHGIDDFVKTGEGYRAVTMKSYDRKTRALWNILSDFERKVAIVNWQVTYPPEEVHGYVVSRVTLDAENRTYPPELDGELDDHWSELSERRGEPPAQSIRRRLSKVDRIFDAATYLLAKERLDFLAVYDHTVDDVEHRYWKYHQPEKFDADLWQLDPDPAGELASQIPGVYRHLDRRLGELMALLSDDALLIVLSDHGQRAAARPRVRLRLNRILGALGHTRLLPAQGDRDRVDYPASSAYTLVETPWKPVLRINLNLRGREPHGIVDPGDAAALTSRLAGDLRSVRFADGEKLFNRVTAVRDPAARDPARRSENGGADLQVFLSRHARSSRSSSRRIVAGGETRPLGEFQRVHSLSGDHDHQGVFFARGPGIKPAFIGQRVVPSALHDLLWRLTDKVDAVDRLLPLLRRLGLIERASTLDLTPTVLYAFGLPVARDMAGSPLRDLFSAPQEVEWVASYETLDQHLLAGEEVSADEEYLERLRALGYVN